MKDNESVQVLSVTANGVQENSLGVYSAVPKKTQFLAIRNSIIATNKGLLHVEDLVLRYKNTCTFSEKRIVNIVTFANGSSIACGEENKVLVYTKKMETVFRSVGALKKGDVVILMHGLKAFSPVTVSLDSIMGAPFRKPIKKRAPINVPSYMTPELATVLGFIGTNDCLRASKIEFAEKEDILDIFKNSMHSLFGNRYVKTATPENNIGGGSTHEKMVKTTSMEVVDYIQYSLENQFLTDRTVPKSILRSKPVHVMMYLRALTLSGVVLKNGFIICKVLNFKFVREIILLLSQFNIKASAKRHGQIATYKSINEPNLLIPGWVIVVLGEDALRFYKLIGFIQEDKHKVGGKMVALLSESLGERVVPNMGITKKVLNELSLKKLTLPTHLRTHFRPETVNKAIEISVLQELSDIGMPVPEMLINEYLDFTQVIGNELSPYAVNTYDVYSEDKTLFSCNNVIMMTEGAPTVK